MPNGGTDNCMNCQHNRANQSTGNIKATRGAERVPFCTIRQVVVANRAWTYCRNIYDDVVEEVLPIYSTGLYERGYDRIPWYGLSEPTINVSIDACAHCGESAEKGILISPIGQTEKQFCSNDHYYQWLEDHPFKSALPDVEQKLLNAAKNGDVESLKNCVEQEATFNVQDENGRTALHLAALNNQPEIVEFLLSNGADANLKTSFKWSPLHCAAFGGNIEIVRSLLDSEVEPALKDLQGYTAAHIAGTEGYSDILNALLEKTLVTEDQKIEALFTAIRAGNLEMVEALINSGVNIESENYRKRTPLLEAVWESQATILTFLLDQGANLYAKDQYGVTAFSVIDEWDAQGKSESSKIIRTWDQINKG